MKQLTNDKDTRGLIQAHIVQDDSGASHNITGNKGVLQNFRNIAKPIPVNGLQKGDAAVYATGVGYLTIIFNDGEVILAECLYAPDVAETIISPTALTKQY